MKVKWKSSRRSEDGKRYLTVATIAEYNKFNREIDPTFTIQEEDVDGLYSLPKLFKSYYKDPTEYQFVMDVFEGDFKHWETFKNMPTIIDYYTEWKKAANAKLYAEAMSKIVETALDTNDRNSFQALKYLVELEKKDTKKQKKVEKEEKVAEVDKELLKDLERLNS